MPYVGFQFVRGSMDYERTRTEHDYITNQTFTIVNTEEVSINLYIPSLGLKYFIKQHNSLNAYLTACISKPFVSGKREYDGKIDEDYQEDIDNVSFWGAEGGFGIEYFFDENFSLGGEFGLRYLHMNFKETYEFESTYFKSKTERVYKYNLSPTYTKISLNFYF